MKKTLIALAVAASAVVSGSTMAADWEQNGSGHSVELGGTLTPTAKVTPWEVKTGDAVTNLNAQVQTGDTSVRVAVNDVIPVLGIRTHSLNVFPAQSGIAPQINYQNAVAVEDFNNGETTLRLDVTDNAKNKIGTMTAPFSAAGVVSVTNNDTKKVSWDSVYASASGKAFFGGVGKTTSGVSDYKGAYSLIEGFSPEFLAKFNKQGVGSPSYSEKFEYDFANGKYIYSAAYGSGIKSGSIITISLDSPVVGNGEIAWNASLPVIVTYM
ncbi:hypothetical protein [Escherichia coli]|uniref:F4 family fimbrial subunit n=1 Tax=Escherichia coli TaxID=562 RepID=UPI000CFDBBA5|nr:hypothetical protein [Escherichia coli]